MPNSRFALHGKRPSLIHGLCAFFASNSRFMRLFQAALDTPPSPPHSQFTVCTSEFAHCRMISCHCNFALENVCCKNLDSLLGDCHSLLDTL